MVPGSWVPDLSFFVPGPEVSGLGPWVLILNYAIGSRSYIWDCNVFSDVFFSELTTLKKFSSVKIAGFDLTYLPMNVCLNPL